YSYTLLDNSRYDFSASNIDTRDYNDSIAVNDIVTIDPNLSFGGGIVSVGSVENGSSINHGFIELFTFEQTGDTITTILLDSYTEVSLANETEYLHGQIIDASIDGTKTTTLIVLLKSIDSTTYGLDFVEYSTSKLELNTSYLIPDTVLETVYDFEVLDVDNDNIAELYLIGTNNSDTQMVLAEMSYNSSSKSFYVSQTISWSNSDNIFIGLEKYSFNDVIHFVIAGLDTSSTLESYIISIGLDMLPVRNFVVNSISTFSQGPDIFRAYSMELLKTDEYSSDKIALFGSYIDNGVDNYPYCLIVTFEDGQVLSTESIRIDNTPNWCVNGLTIDINFDNESEILMLTYDLTGPALSNYSIYSSSIWHTEIDQGFTPIRRIRLSTAVTLDDLQIGMFVGKNALARDTIAIYKIQHLPMKLKGNSEVLLENSVNDFYLETYDYDGSIVSRSDITFDVGFTDNITSYQTFSELPRYFSFSIDELVGEIPLQRNMSLQMTRGSNLLVTEELSLFVQYLPEFTVRTPTSTVIMRDGDSKNETFVLEITNNYLGTLEVNASLVPPQSYRIKSTEYSVDAQQDSTKILVFTFIGTDPATKYLEQIVIRFETNTGIFELAAEIKVTNKLTLIFNDILIIFWIAILVVLVFYGAFGLAINKLTVQKVDRHFSMGEPLELEYQAFKKRALNSLLRRYTQEGDWKAGLKLAEEYMPDFTPHFHKYRARDQLSLGQNLEWVLAPLQRINEAVQMKKGAEKVKVLQKEFQGLNTIKGQTKIIYQINLDIPSYLVAEQLGLALRDIEELQSSLNYLQLAYQGAPNELKNRIVNEITSLISLGVQPAEMSIPVDHAAIKERIEKRRIGCFSCGEERTNMNEPCANCGVDTVYCSVCKLPISFGADYLECYHCENI
ncbi:MAG: hypothetical protein ACTSSH_09900, partial [Candidatus Heimdallarchaeota archaeon]